MRNILDNTGIFSDEESDQEPQTLTDQNQTFEIPERTDKQLIEMLTNKPKHITVNNIGDKKMF